MLVNGKVTIKADADLDHIAKVRVLSVENGEINILNETSAQQGQTVELSYDAPAGTTRLFAACVAADGTTLMQGFNVGQTSVSFKSGVVAKARFRAFENAAYNIADCSSPGISEMKRTRSGSPFRLGRLGQMRTKWSRKGYPTLTARTFG